MRATEKSKVERVQSLLRAGRSYREIERETGVCKSVVGRINNATSTATVAGSRARAVQYIKTVRYYCSHCEKVVTLRPCVACQARTYLQEHSQKVISV